jgi:hypothetical protein
MSRTVRVWLAILVLAAGWLLWQQGCHTPLEDIVVADGAVTVRNQTPQEWLDVRIWVNEHYAGGARSIPASGFVREPLSRFIAAQGQKIDIATTAITSVVVLGRTPDGTRVRVVWGKPLLH